jgi:hypothetical protein
MSELSLSEIRPLSASYVDPNGFLFEYDNRLLRGISAGREDFYRDLIQKSGTELSFGAAPGVVRSQISGFSVPERNCRLVLEHERIRPLTFCVEWPPSMLKAAALLTLQLCQRLVRSECTLQDAYPWNVVFSGTKPVMVDLTSIVPTSGPYLWSAYQQYLNFFMYPLRLAESGKGKFARQLLFDTINGVTIDDYQALLDFRDLLAHPLNYMGTKLSYKLARRIQHNTALKLKLQQSMKDRKVDAAMREKFFAGLVRKTESIRLTRPKTTWVNYYQEINRDIDVDKKVQIIDGILKHVRPATVLDVGCNTGKFSILAARNGAKVISADADVGCIESLFHVADENSLPITPLVVDILSPTPAFGQFASQFPAFSDRARSQMVFALALMHHLHINGRQSFERIARIFSQLAEKYLIFEFVSMDDDNNRLLDHGREIDYSLETVCDALSAHFTLEVMESDRATRKLILCTKK